MRAAEWLADRAGAMLARAVERMPASRQEWGHAMVAELSAAPSGWARFWWAVSGLWFAVQRREFGQQRAPLVNGALPYRGLRRLYAMLGAGPVAFWAFVSWLQLQDDAPDIPRHLALMLFATELSLVVAFLANWWLPRAGLVAVWTVIPAYAVVSAVAAAGNDGSPVLAALIFAVPPLFAAVPLVFLPRAVGSHP